MHRRIATLCCLAAVVLSTAACGPSKVENYELGEYKPQATSTEYAVRIGVGGNADLGTLSTLLGSGSGSTGIDIALTGDALGTVVEESNGFRYTLEITNIDAKLPFGGRFPEHTEKLVWELDTKGHIESTDGEGILGMLPAMVKGIGWTCPELPAQPVRAGDQWQSEARVIWQDSTSTIKQDNTWVEIDSDDRQVARISSSADAPFTKEMDLEPIASFLGINSSLLAGLKATLDGSLHGTSTCDLTIPDQKLVETSSHHDLEITVRLSGGSGNLASLVGDLKLHLSVDESMRPKS